MSSKLGVFGGGVGGGPCTNTQSPSIIYENFRGLFIEEPFVTSKAHEPRYLMTNVLVFWGFYEYLHFGCNNKECHLVTMLMIEMVLSILNSSLY